MNRTSNTFASTSSSSSSSSSLLKSKGDTFNVETPEADEVEQLLKKLSEMGNVADHASRRIVELDKIMGTLRKNRAALAEAVTKDTANLEHLTKAENEVLHRIQQLETSATSRKNDIDRIHTTLNHTEKNISTFIQQAHTTSVQSIHNYTAHTSNYISSSLQAQRGYTVKPNTTPGHIVNSTVRTYTIINHNGYEKSSAFEFGYRIIMHRFTSIIRFVRVQLDTIYEACIKKGKHKNFSYMVQALGVDHDATIPAYIYLGKELLFIHPTGNTFSLEKKEGKYVTILPSFTNQETVLRIVLLYYSRTPNNPR